MAVKLTDLAKEVGLSATELRAKLSELGFEIKASAKSIEYDVAELVKAEIVSSVVKKSTDETAIHDVEVVADGADGAGSGGGTVETYESLIEKQLEREIVKSQRKKMAGKDGGGKKDASSGSGAASGVSKDGVIEIPDVITVKEFSEKTGLSAARVIGELMKNGILANINQQIDFETASIISSDLGVHIKRKRGGAALTDIFEGNVEALLREDDEDVLKPRPPVVVIMGHVDHGKTKLLDYIRHTNVVDKEAGGITQHIGAYQVEKNGRKITFLDTPGHEAFTAMRARGAKVTDIAVLVVAADEGVKPQTVEALNHAKEAGVPIIVALNKMDKPGAQVDRVKGELAEHGLQPEDWGGTTVMVPISALTGLGVDQLLEMILLTADMQNMKANPDREAVATVIEAHLDKSLGPVATVVVNAGTLHIMDSFVVGSTSGRVKTMKDHLGKNMDSAPPSMPVFIAGLAETPQSGDILHVVADDRIAREKALQIGVLKKAHEDAGRGGLSTLLNQINEGKLKTLKFILKADTQGSLEAIRYSLSQVKDEQVQYKVIHAGVGSVSDGDVMMAAASGGLVIGFHVDVPSPVKRTAELHHVEIAVYDIIYKLLDDLKNILSGLLEPEALEVILGRAEVKQVFLHKKTEQIVGCRVLSGSVENRAKVRLWREDKMIGEGEIGSLKFIDKAVNEINEGNECGVRYVSPIPVLPGDIFECYKIEHKKRSLA